MNKTEIMPDEKIIEAILKERVRCMEIANDFCSKYSEEFRDSKQAGNDFAFVKYEMAEVARYIGNAISGLNALNVHSETMETIIIKEQKR